MPQLGIEMHLKEEGEKEGIPLYDKYNVLKNRLLTKEYSFWAMGFPGGNDHGPQHISRVLEKLDSLLGEKPIEQGLINVYELFLAMMSILYHDVGILQERKTHPLISGELLNLETNEYIFDEYDREIIYAAIVSHSSQKDIEVECSRFSHVELIGAFMVRPRVIAALVRLADELDEDYRRADPVVAQRIKIPEESNFFWLFCQHIQGIRPNLRSHEIHINVKIESKDIGRKVLIDGQSKLFLKAFAEKLAKINSERVKVNSFLPENLQYNSIRVSVRPPTAHNSFKHPRHFIFSDHTSVSEFINAFPELFVESTKDKVERVLDFIKIGQLREARTELLELEELIADLPDTVQLPTLFKEIYEENLRVRASGMLTELRQSSPPSSAEDLRLKVEYVEDGLDGASYLRSIELVKKAEKSLTFISYWEPFLNYLAGTTSVIKGKSKVINARRMFYDAVKKQIYRHRNSKERFHRRIIQVPEEFRSKYEDVPFDMDTIFFDYLTHAASVHELNPRSCILKIAIARINTHFTIIDDRYIIMPFLTHSKDKRQARHGALIFDDNEGDLVKALIEIYTLIDDDAEPLRLDQLHRLKQEK